MKLLTITTLYPNAEDPKHGVFIENRLRQLQLRYPDVEATVIAPVPWFPFRHARFGTYGRYAAVPDMETRYGIKVYHPRYLVIPKIGMNLTPYTLAHSLKNQVGRLQAQGEQFDLIDGHYFFPDGVAIHALAQSLRLPFTVTARGTDINLIPSYPRPLQQIQHVLKHSQHNLAVCEALRQAMIGYGADPTRTTTARNGVDLNVFRCVDEIAQPALRQSLQLPTDRPVIISVGLLVERKGHHLVIEALSQIPDALLLIAGTGPDERKLRQLATQLGVAERVTFLGGLSQSVLADYFAASDISVLASSREGWANVLLESMACGTPVVATNIWGTPEVVSAPEAGVLVERDSSSIAQGLCQLLAHRPSRRQTRQYAEQFSWDDTSDLLYHLFTQIISGRNPPLPAPSIRHTRSETEHDKEASL
ncbi:glycosyltransferase family 4 protein [Photobacterium ganghwense]|uniref:glycosyltransferase family 4 protein n=1 Tax=Photobacterium ganghwense TaxID=320778 RepID=UPI0039F0336E